MEVITKERLIELRAKYAENLNIKDGCLIDDLIHDELIDIDQLIVAKLRPMNEANRNDGESECLLFLKGFSLPYEGFWDETSWVLYAFDELKSDDDFEGWIPMPIYKPE